MAQYDGSIRINTKINTDGMKAGEREIGSSMNRIADNARRVSATIAAAFAIGKLVQFGKEAIELGSDLEEVQNVVDVTFTTMSEKVNEFAKNAATTAGLSETMAKRYAGTFGAMSKSFGFTEAEAYSMSTALTQLTGDVASFYNISQDLAYIKLKSVFTGETETLKELGVVMTQSALDAYAMANGFGKTTAAMTEQEKVALRLRFVQDQLSAASGDFIRTSDSWANQVRIMQLQIQSLKATIGQGLINLFTPIIKVINIVLSKLAVLANAFKSFTALITGKKASGGGGGSAIPSGGELADTVGGYEDAAGAVDDLAKSTGKAAKATDKAKKAAEGYLSPLDEINKFTKEAETSSGAGGAGGGGAAGGGVDFGELAQGETVIDDVNESTNALLEKLKELRDIFMQGFWDGLGDFQYRLDIIKNGLESIKNSLIEIWTDPAVLAAADNWINSVAYLLGSFAGSVASIGLTIAANLIGGLAKYLEQNKERIKGYLVSMFDIWSEINYLLSDLFQSIAYVFEAFASEQGQQLTANIIGMITDAFMGATELISKLVREILNIFIQPFVDNKEELRTALEGFLGVLSEVTGTIKEGIDDTFAKLNEVYDEHFKPFFDSVAQGLSDLVGEFLEFWNGSVQPVLDSWAKAFDKLWKEHIQPAIDNIIELLGDVADFLKAVWENVLQPFISWIIKNILPKILPIVDTLVKTLFSFLGTVSDIINDVTEIFRGIVQFLTGIFTLDWQTAWDGLGSIIDGFAGLVGDIIGGVIEIFGGILSYIVGEFTRGWEEGWNSVTGFFEGVKNTIQDIIDGILGFIGDLLGGVRDAIRGIDDLESKINSVSSRSVSSIVDIGLGGFSRSVSPYSNVPGIEALANMKIPGYATGQVIPRNMQKHLAILGDNNRETEVVSPLSTIKQANKESLLEVLSELGLTGGGRGGNTYNVRATARGKTIFDLVIEEGKIQQMATGRNPFALE